MSSGISAYNEGYVKTVWQTGDVITAEKLNNMETGIEKSTKIFVIPFEIDTINSTINTETTFSEVLTAYQKNLLIIGNVFDTRNDFHFSSFFMRPEFSHNEIVMFAGKLSDINMKTDALGEFTEIEFDDMQLEFSDNISLTIAYGKITDQGLGSYSSETYTSEV